MIATREILAIAVLTAGALTSWYVSQSSSDEEVATPSLDGAHRGYYLKAARILGTGPDGSLLYELRAREAEQLDEEGVEMGWDTYLVPYGKETSTTVYALNFAARAAMTLPIRSWALRTSGSPMTS